MKLLIVGPKGTGKTTFAKELALQLEKDGEECTIIEDNEDIKDYAKNMVVIRQRMIDVPNEYQQHHPLSFFHTKNYHFKVAAKAWSIVTSPTVKIVDYTGRYIPPYDSD